MEVNIAQYNGELLGITLPEKVEYTIVKCDPAVKGNTQNNALKDAYIETGLLVKVPMFIEQGEKIIITTEDGKYYSRA
jgi:elongation factor P